MKTLSLLLLTSFTLLTQGLDDPAFVASLTVTAAASGPTYLVEENFDGTGDPGAAWTEFGTSNWDYTTSPAPLEGTQSASCDGTAAAAYLNWNNGSGVDALEVFFLFHIPSTLEVSETLVYIYDSGATIVGYVLIHVGAVLRIYNGTAFAATTGTIAADTTYYIWVRWEKGTGADGFASVAFSTDGTRPNSGNNYKEVTTGTATAQAQQVRPSATYSSGTGNFIIFDDFKATAGDAIPSNP